MLPDYRRIERDPEGPYEPAGSDRSAFMPAVILLAIVALAAVLLFATGNTSGDQGSPAPEVSSTTAPTTLVPGGAQVLP